MESFSLSWLLWGCVLGLSCALCWRLAETWADLELPHLIIYTSAVYHLIKPSPLTSYINLVQLSSLPRSSNNPQWYCVLAPSLLEKTLCSILTLCSLSRSTLSPPACVALPWIHSQLRPACQSPSTSPADPYLLDPLLFWTSYPHH